MKVFVAPPFGNYINLPNILSVRGSFTVEPRSGLFQQICKTLRFSSQHNGWINKIGLRNKGIDYGIEKYGKSSTGNGNVISIAILQKTDISEFLSKIPTNTNLEINVSCPNAEKSMIDEDIDKFLHSERKWCIIKVSPLISHNKLDSYYEKGFRQFHMSNTYPTDAGGLSGPYLIPHNKKNIEYMRNKYPDATIIGGGGVQTPEHIELYKSFGANHISVSSLCFNPIKFLRFYSGIY